MPKQRQQSRATKRFEFSTMQKEYEAYLSRERGLAAATNDRYWWVVSRFLVACSGKGAIDPGAIGLAQISSFVVREARKGSRTAQTTATALRSFLRFLFRQGWTTTDLAGSVPRVPIWGQANLPRYLPGDQVERLLSSCDRATSIGRRDYAVLLLLARLGLRASEVVALGLDDVDWRAGELLIRGKGKLHDRLPLPHDVGEAVAAYLRRDRQGETRRLFIRTKGPRDVVRALTPSPSMLCGTRRRRVRLAEIGKIRSHQPHIGRHPIAEGRVRDQRENHVHHVVAEAAAVEGGKGE
jgi:integrase/recombinase XerD